MENLANEYRTSLNGGIDSVQTTIVVAVAPPAGLSGGNFRLRLGAPDSLTPEYVLVGTVSGTTLLGCTRHVEGSATSAWSSGTSAVGVVTVAGLNDRISSLGGSGSGLPSQWSAGAHGNVTAKVDDNTVGPTLTVEALDNVQEPLVKIKTPDTNGSQFQQLFVLEDGDNVQVFSINSAGEITQDLRDVSAGAFKIFTRQGSQAAGAHVFKINAEPNVGSSLIDVEADGKLSIGNPALPNGLRLIGPHAAPAGSALNSGDLMFWIDPTPGATKLGIIAKDSNGTVRTGSVNLT